MARRIQPSVEPKSSAKESTMPGSVNDSLNITSTEQIKKMRVDVFRKTVVNDNS